MTEREVAGSRWLYPPARAAGRSAPVGRVGRLSAPSESGSRCNRSYVGILFYPLRYMAVGSRRLTVRAIRRSPPVGIALVPSMRDAPAALHKEGPYNADRTIEARVLGAAANLARRTMARRRCTCSRQPWPTRAGVLSSSTTEGRSVSHHELLSRSTRRSQHGGRPDGPAPGTSCPLPAQSKASQAR